MRLSLLRFPLLAGLLPVACAADPPSAASQTSDLLEDESIASVTFDGATYHATCIDGRQVDVPYAEYAERLRQKAICAPPPPPIDLWPAVGPEIQACPEQHQPATVAVGPNDLAVGCVPAAERAIPTVPVFTHAGVERSRTSFLPSEGRFLRPLDLSMHGGELQVLYDPIDDTDTLPNPVNRIELRELTLDGALVRSTRWGGKSGGTGASYHPALAFTGAELGVAFSSPKCAAFSRIGNRGLIPYYEWASSTSFGCQSTETFNAARNAVVWSPELRRYRVFNIFSRDLFTGLLTEKGNLEGEYTRVARALAETKNYDLAATSTPNGFVVAYVKPGVANRLVASFIDGATIMEKELLPDGEPIGTVSAFRTQGGVHFVTGHSQGRLAITSFSFDGKLLARGLLGTVTGVTPKAAYDLGTQTVAVTWLDANAAVHVQRFSFTR